MPNYDFRLSLLALTALLLAVLPRALRQLTGKTAPTRKEAVCWTLCGVLCAVQMVLEASLGTAVILARGAMAILYFLFGGINIWQLSQQKKAP